MDEYRTVYLKDEAFYIPRRYVIDRFIGQGSYGVVVAAKDIITGELVAIKKNKGIFSTAGTNGKTQCRSILSQKRILRELKLLIHLQHPNIVNVKEVFIPQNYDTFCDIYFVTELMEADLRDILCSDQTLTEEHIQYFLFQLLLSVNYMHSANVLHRDIKPENILINSDCQLKICDLGLARGIDFELNPTMSTNYVQTRWYRAPELLLNNPTVSKQTDMWSVGCIFAELMNREVLFKGKSPTDQIKKIVSKLGKPDPREVHGTDSAIDYLNKMIPDQEGIKDWSQVFPGMSALAIDLLLKMLEFNYEKRISASEALRHEYFASLFDPAAITLCPTLFDFKYEDGLDNLPPDSEVIKKLSYKTLCEYVEASRDQDTFDDDMDEGDEEEASSQQTENSSMSMTPGDHLYYQNNESDATGLAPGARIAGKQQVDSTTAAAEHKSSSFIQKVRSFLSGSTTSSSSTTTARGKSV
ncbi:mitogen-activated protein kinase [Acrasis kona]|uniref:Mitogen-activated protein kinase n=1 Tax=Acrasis kona TaxID=1008807 RepID=A0AAW2ZJ36_9EUKA